MKLDLALSLGLAAADFVSNTTHLSISIAAKLVKLIHVQNQKFDCKRIAALRALKPSESPPKPMRIKKKWVRESATKGLWFGGSPCVG